MKTIDRTASKNPMKIVDDDKDFRKLTRMVLEDANYEIDVMETVSSAQQQLADQEYDIVTTDIVLPGTSGRELLKIIHGHNPAAPIILMTGYPRGLKGDEICLGARIFAVMDAYDAMRSARVSKDSISEEMLHCNGVQFDPTIVEVFLNCRTALEEIAIRDSLRPSFS